MLKRKKEYKKLKETGEPKYIYQNKLDKACFKHDIPYGNFNSFPRITAADKVLHDKAFNIAKSPKCDGYEYNLASLVYILFDKKSFGSSVNSEVIPNRKLAEELHKPIIKKFEKRKAYPSFKDNIWGTNLEDMKLISKFNKGNHFLWIVDWLFF